MSGVSWLARLSLWLPPLAYMGLIFYLSSQSAPLPELTEHVWDKLLHFAEYGALAFLLSRALVGEGMGWVTALAVAIVLASGYAASDEWHQSFVPLRNSDIHDWMADTLGAGIGAVIYRISRSAGL